MSIECSECEWDARAGHDPDCSRDPANILRAENERLRMALIEHHPLDADRFSCRFCAPFFAR